jgi:hypothetical protein
MWIDCGLSSTIAGAMPRLQNGLTGHASEQPFAQRLLET